MRWNCALIPDMGPSLNRIPLYALTVREEGRIGGARIILPDNNLTSNSVLIPLVSFVLICM